MLPYRQLRGHQMRRGQHDHPALPELMEANLFPGVTYCVESCGGPGCGCFYLSSGCLFYRVFMKPESTEIFEIFSCSRWREEVVLHITVTTDKKTTVNEARHLRPTISVQHQSLKSSTQFDYRTTLSQCCTRLFIAARTRRAMDGNQLPPLQCTSNREAEAMACDVHPICNCHLGHTGTTLLFISWYKFGITVHGIACLSIADWLFSLGSFGLTNVLHIM
ncbi:hypothetical protein COOONC_21226 [Cooperia oncophora]